MMYLEAKTRFKSQQKQVAQMRNNFLKLKYTPLLTELLMKLLPKKDPNLLQE